MSDYIPVSAETQRLDLLKIAGYVTPKGLYYQVDDLKKADLVFPTPPICIFGIEGLVAVNGEAVEEKEGLPQEEVVSLDLGWHIGESARLFEAALLANGILTRFMQGKKVVKLQSLARFALFSPDQTEALLAAVPIINDHEGTAYSPLHDLVDYINNVIARSLDVGNVPEEYKLMIKDPEGGNTIVYDKRWTPSMLLFWRFLQMCTTTQYNPERGDFALNGLIMVTDDSASMGAAKERKNAIIREEKENPLSEIHTYKSENRQQVRIKWPAFRDLFMKKYMNGRLAKLWRDTMVHGGELLSAGHPSVLKIFAARQSEHQTATPDERRMLQEQVDTANKTGEANGVVDAIETAAPVYSAEEIAVYEKLARLKSEEKYRLSIDFERMKMRQQTYLALKKEQIRSNANIKIAAEHLQAEKERKMSADKVCLEQYRREREKEEVEKLKGELNAARLTINMKEDKIEHFEKRLERKDEQLAKKDEQIVDLQKQLQRSRKRIHALTIDEQ